MAGARRLAASALLLAASLVLVAATLELGFRGVEAVQRWREPETWAIYDEELGYRLNPGYRDINAHRLRDHPLTPPSSRFRVLMLGDSLAYDGEDVDDTWVGRLRALLNVGREEPVEVWNAGVPGYTNYQELLYLRRDGVRLEPDLVGVGFVWNDLFRFLHQFRVEEGRIVGNRFVLTSEAVGDAAASPPLWQRSLFLAWLRRRLSALDWRAATDPTGFTFERRPDLATAWQDAPWRDVAGQLEAMQQLGREHGFGIFVVAFPVAAQYREALLARDRDYVLKPQRMLREICARLGIPLLDLYPLLDGGQHIQGDGIHLTAAGRAEVAARVARFLEDQDLVPLGSS